MSMIKFKIYSWTVGWDSVSFSTMYLTNCRLYFHFSQLISYLQSINTALSSDTVNLSHLLIWFDESNVEKKKLLFLICFICRSGSSALVSRSGTCGGSGAASAFTFSTFISFIIVPRCCLSCFWSLETPLLPSNDIFRGLTVWCNNLP